MRPTAAAFRKMMVREAMYEETDCRSHVSSSCARSILESLVSTFERNEVERSWFFQDESSVLYNSHAITGSVQLYVPIMLSILAVSFGLKVVMCTTSVNS